MEYLVKSSACLCLLYVGYLLFFRNTDRFQMNRMYLVVGLVVSFIVPTIVLPVAPVQIVVTSAGDTFVPPEMQGTAVAPSRDINVLAVVYYSGVLIALWLSAGSFLRFFRMYMNRGEGNVVIRPDVQPCSFMGILFIRSRDEDPMIVAHEMVHIRQRHWIDLLLAEIAVAILWFNPIVYLYRRSIVIQHEYIADRSVVSQGSLTEYLNCIKQHLESNILSPLVNSFNTRSIKQRIIMMTSTRTYSPLRYAIAVPVIAVFTMAFASIPPMQNRELRAPVDVRKAKQAEGAAFGKRINPLTKKEQFHTGVDFALAAGNNVYAAASGTVVEAKSSEGYGNLIIVRHDEKLATSYSHLEKILVKRGDRVERGQVIGLVGSTGLSVGPHLHFEVLEKGKAVDPVPYLDMSVD